VSVLVVPSPENGKKKKKKKKQKKKEKDKKQKRTAVTWAVASRRRLCFVEFTLRLLSLRERSWRFDRSSDDIETRVAECDPFENHGIMGGDIGRNIFRWARGRGQTQRADPWLSGSVIRCVPITSS